MQIKQGHLYPLFIVAFCSVLSLAKADIALRDYKVSLVIFKHFPADHNTSPRLQERWSTAKVEDCTLISKPNQTASSQPYNILLPSSLSTLTSTTYALSKNKNYAVMSHANWNTQLPYGSSQCFYLDTSLPDGSTLDTLLKITLKYNLDITFQTQLLTPTEGHFYTINTVNDSFQIPSNQMQYIDGPIYGALIKITRV